MFFLNLIYAAILWHFKTIYKSTFSAQSHVTTFLKTLNFFYKDEIFG